MRLGDSRPQLGKYDYTSLKGTDRLRVLRTLPAKLDTILPSNLAVSMAQLWNVSVFSDCVLHVLRSMQFREDVQVGKQRMLCD